MKRFYGKYAHALVAVPRGKIENDPNTRAPIVRRIEVTRATGDVVKVTLRLVDSLGRNMKTILVDRHYSCKKLLAWQRALIQRGIRQVFGLRSDDHKVLRHPDATYIDGFAHCPATPMEYFLMPRPGVFATKAEHQAFQKRTEKRQAHAHFVINQMDADEHEVASSCSRAQGGVPAVSTSMEVVAELGLEIINADLLELEPGQEPPRCCMQDPFRITLPEEVTKLNQINYWGSVV